MIFLGFNIYYATFPTHAAKDLKWSVTQLGIFYAILSGIMVLIQGPVLRKALKRFSEEKLVKIGSVILATNFILFVSNNIVSVGGAIILFAVGNGLMWPSFMSNCQDMLDQNSKAQYKALQVVSGVWQAS
ncbi:MAG: MFS transporter [Nitrososphaeraceae archaeon]|nr:MFS transporter [Nitrososphaeraceae archaeon]